MTVTILQVDKVQYIGVTTYNICKENLNVNQLAIKLQ